MFFPTTQDLAIISGRSDFHLDSLTAGTAYVQLRVLVGIKRNQCHRGEWRMQLGSAGQVYFCLHDCSTKSYCENSQYSFVVRRNRLARTHSTKSSCENSQYSIVLRGSQYSIVLQDLTVLIRRGSNESCKISQY